MPAKWKGDNKSIAKVREECARHTRVQEYFFNALQGGRLSCTCFICPATRSSFPSASDLVPEDCCTVSAAPSCQQASKWFIFSSWKGSKREELLSLCFLLKNTFYFPK